MFTAQRDLVPWLISQTDALATDWCVVPTPAEEALPSEAMAGAE